MAAAETPTTHQAAREAGNGATVVATGIAATGAGAPRSSGRSAGMATTPDALEGIDSARRGGPLGDTSVPAMSSIANSEDSWLRMSTSDRAAADAAGAPEGSDGGTEPEDETTIAVIGTEAFRCVFVNRS